MDKFSADTIDYKTIGITSNTSWECYSIGNFKLSKYSGNGNDTINVALPDDIKFGSGYVYFSYGTEKCDYPYITIASANDCFIETIPKYKICDNVKTAFLYYKNAGEIVDITIDTVNQWSVSNGNGLTYFIEGNKLSIVTKDDDTFLTLSINPDNACDEFKIVLKKKS